LLSNESIAIATSRLHINYGVSIETFGGYGNEGTPIEAVELVYAGSNVRVIAKARALLWKWEDCHSNKELVRELMQILTLRLAKYIHRNHF